MANQLLAGDDIVDNQPGYDDVNNCIADKVKQEHRSNDFPAVLFDVGF